MQFVFHSSSTEVLQASQKRQIQASLKKTEMRKDSALCMHPTQQRAPLDTRILMGKVQVLTGKGGGVLL